MTTISADALRAGAPVQITKVDLWDGHHAYVKGMTAKEKNNFDASMMAKDWKSIDRRKVRRQKQLMICRCLTDDFGNRLLTDEDVEAVSEWPADIANRVFDLANKLSGGSTDSDYLSDSDETDDG